MVVPGLVTLFIIIAYNLGMSNHLQFEKSRLAMLVVFFNQSLNTRPKDIPLELQFLFT